MANKQQQNKAKQRKAVVNALQSLGITSGFMHLVDQAVRNAWTTQDFLNALKESHRFQRMYPGLVEHDGSINSYLGFNLAEAVHNYKRLTDAYQLTTKGVLNLTRQQIGLLIRRQVSPDEFGTKFNAYLTAKSNPTLLENLNEQLRAMGRPTIDQVGFLRVLSGTASRNFYDAYEAAYLQSQGLNITGAEALGAAQALGAPGELTDIGALIRQVRLIKPDIGPELQAAGISDADLVQLEGGVDPRGLEPRLRQMVAQRRTMAQGPIGSIPQQRAGGGFALYPQDELSLD